MTALRVQVLHLPAFGLGRRLFIVARSKLEIFDFLTDYDREVKKVC